MDAQASTASHQAEKWSPSSDASDIVKSIHAMLHPRNIVLVGATDKPGNYAERIWNNLIKYKYEGGLFPVNAKRETIWGVTCYKDFASLPEKPDHVLVLVPARFAVQVIRDAALAGIRCPFDMTWTEGERLPAAACEHDGAGMEPLHLDASDRPCIRP